MGKKKKWFLKILDFFQNFFANISEIQDFSRLGNDISKKTNSRFQNLTWNPVTGENGDGLPPEADRAQHVEQEADAVVDLRIIYSTISQIIKYIM